MDLVVDANIIFAALIKDSFSYYLLFSGRFHLFAPEYVFTEIEKHKEELLEKTERTTEEFYRLLEVLKRRINIVPLEELTEYVEKVNDLLQIRYEQAKEYSWPMSILGLIGSSAIGTGIGALVGYFTDGINGAKSFAAWGAAMGALFEFMFHPTYTFLSYKYIRSEIKSFKEPKAAELKVKELKTKTIKKEEDNTFVISVNGKMEIPEGGIVLKKFPIKETILGDKGVRAE